MSQLNEMNLPSYPLLTEEENMALLKAAKAGDQEARERMIQCNLRLVYNLVQRFYQRGYEPDELFQIGVIGLMKSIDKFDERFEVKFSTYAVPMIIGEIRRFLRDDSPIKISRSLKERSFAIKRAKEVLEADLGREATLKEIAERCQLPLEDVIEAMEADAGPISLNIAMYREEEEEILEHISDGRNENWFEHLALKEVLRYLPEREQAILQLRFFEDKTQSEVAKKVGISQVQVSRLERAALKKVREYLKAE